MNGPWQKTRGVGLLCAMPFLQGESVTLTPVKDNTLIESTTGSLSNGAGRNFFVGRVGAVGGNGLRRGLLAFDLTGSIPSGSIVDGATLTLRLASNNSGRHTVGLHRAVKDWGEGASSSGGGMGATATPGDATWLHTFFPRDLWAQAGGDFVVPASASRPVSGTRFYNWTSPDLVADVQAWVDDPSRNFGWVVIGDESTRSAKGFDSREATNASRRPMLSVDFTPPPALSVEVETGPKGGKRMARVDLTGSPPGAPVFLAVGCALGETIQTIPPLGVLTLGLESPFARQFLGLADENGALSRRLVLGNKRELTLHLQSFSVEREVNRGGPPSLTFTPSSIVTIDLGFGAGAIGSSLPR